MDHPGSTSDLADEIADLDEAVGRRASRLLAPVRNLVNAPYLLVGAVIIIWIACSGAYAVIEGKGFIEGLWWGIVTGSTVGYGDSYPSSTPGRAVAVILIVSMLILVPIAIGHVIASLVMDRDQFSHDEQVALAGTVEAIHDRVDRLEHVVLAFVAEQQGAEWVTARIAEFNEAESAHQDIDDRMLAVFQKEAD